MGKTVSLVVDVFVGILVVIFVEVCLKIIEKNRLVPLYILYKMGKKI